MKILIVEDDFTCRKLLQKLLSLYGECDIAVDGKEAVEAFKMAWVQKDPYDLICMDIMMPNMDGQDALKEIRTIENDLGIKDRDHAKIIMTTSLDDPKNVMKAYYKGGATSYMVKPVSKKQLLEELIKLNLIEAERI